MGESQVYVPSAGSPGWLQYRASGRVCWPLFLPLLAAGVLVAIVNGILSAIVQDYWNWVLITQLVVALPITGYAYLLVKFGKVRNAKVAGISGALLGLLFQTVFWTTGWAGYEGVRMSAKEEGREGPPELKEATGMGGPIGYYLLSANTAVYSKVGSSGAKREHTGFDTVMAHILQVVEFGVAIGMPMGAMLVRADRVFFEAADRWAKSVSYIYGPEHALTILKAMEEKNFGSIAALPPFKPKNEKDPSVVLKIEYFPGVPAAGMFLSVATTLLASAAELVDMKKANPSFNPAQPYSQVFLAPEYGTAMPGLFPKLNG